MKQTLIPSLKPGEALAIYRPSHSQQGARVHRLPRELHYVQKRSCLTIRGTLFTSVNSSSIPIPIPCCCFHSLIHRVPAPRDHWWYCASVFLVPSLGHFVFTCDLTGWTWRRLCAWRAHLPSPLRFHRHVPRNRRNLPCWPSL
jgi:hypothetical protein